MSSVAKFAALTQHKALLCSGVLGHSPKPQPDPARFTLHVATLTLGLSQ